MAPRTREEIIADAADARRRSGQPWTFREESEVEAELIAAGVIAAEPPKETRQ